MNILPSVVLPIVVAGVALSVAIIGSVIVGSGEGADSINLFVDGTVSGNSQQWLGGLIGASALFALAAGMASAVNPCGFAMLPAYLGLYLGSNQNVGNMPEIGFKAIGWAALAVTALTMSLVLPIVLDFPLWAKGLVGGFAITVAAGIFLKVGWTLLKRVCVHDCHLEVRRFFRKAPCQLKYFFRGVWRALLVGGVVSGGFVLLFGIVGAIVGVSASFVSDVLPLLGLAIGIGLILAGAWTLGERKVYTRVAARAAGRMGNPNQVSIKGYLLFGLSYGTASLSCTLPIFISVVGIGVAGFSAQEVATNFFLYAAGMGLVIMGLTMGMAFFKGAMVGFMRKAIPFMQPSASGFMILAGTYIVFYWLTVGRDLL